MSNGTLNLRVKNLLGAHDGYRVAAYIGRYAFQSAALSFSTAYRRGRCITRRSGTRRSAPSTGALIGTAERLATLERNVLGHGGFLVSHEKVARLHSVRGGEANHVRQWC